MCLRAWWSTGGRRRESAPRRRPAAPRRRERCGGLLDHVLARRCAQRNRERLVSYYPLEARSPARPLPVVTAPTRMMRMMRMTWPDGFSRMVDLDQLRFEADRREAAANCARRVVLW